MGNASKMRQKPQQNRFMARVVRVSGYGLLAFGIITAIIAWAWR